MNARLLGLALLLAVQQLPTEIAPVRFNSGQDIVPYFEGWIRNSDGTFDLVFGYFNRNWKEEIAIPPGANNRVEPYGPDAGQPTYFLPRRQRWVFRVRIPADFGKKEVTWTLTANGRTEKAYGTLLAAEEITERVIMTNGGYDPGTEDPNEPPLITIAPVENVIAGTAVTLRVSIVDDGLPKPRAARAPRPATGTEAGTAGAFGGQIDRPASTAPRGPSVSWLQLGGPAKVTFEQTGPIPIVNGQAATTARFAAPGTYRLRVRGSDGALSKTSDIVVVVR
jgi:hypothetical protein